MTTPEATTRTMTEAELTAFVSAMTDKGLEACSALVRAEQTARDKRRKEAAIAKIREMAGEAGLSVSIAGARGRPGGSKPPARPAKAEAAK
jgi:hypothetical protein